MKKNIAFFGAIALVLVVLCCTVKFQSVEDYNREHGIGEGKVIGSFTFSVRCDTIFDNLDKLDPDLTQFLPEDGAFYAAQVLDLYEKDTPLGVLERIAAKKGIALEIDRGQSSYLRGIGNIREYSCGPESGWLYHVNGRYLPIAGNGYTIRDGDVVEWLYTCAKGDLGKDFGTGS